MVTPPRKIHPHFIRSPTARPQLANSSRPRQSKTALLDFDGRASLGKLLLDGLSLVLRYAFLDGLRRSVNQILGFLQAQAGDFADRLNHVNLVGAHFLQDDRELRLLFRRSRRCRSTAARHHHRGCRRRRDAETLFQLLHQLRSLQKRQAYNRFFQLLYIRHCHFSSSDRNQFDFNSLYFTTESRVSSAPAPIPPRQTREEPDESTTTQPLTASS